MAWTRSGTVVTSLCALAFAALGTAVPVWSAPPQEPQLPAFEPGRAYEAGTESLVITGATPAEIDEYILQGGLRLVTLDTEPNLQTFAAAFVPNNGAWATQSWWYPSLTKMEVEQKRIAHQARVVELDPYWVPKKGWRYAVVLVPEAGKAGQVYLELPESEMKKVLSQPGTSVVDFDSAAGVKGKTIYFVVTRSGVSQTSVMQSQYPDNIRCEIGWQCSDKTDQRVMSLEDAPGGSWDAILVPETTGEWTFAVDLSAEDLQRHVHTRGLRVIDVAAYETDGEVRYGYVGIDRLNSEEKRLRELARTAFDKESDGFGFDVMRGFFVKAVGADHIAGMAADLPMQMLSVAKLVTYLYALDEISKGKETLVSTISWREPLKDNPKTGVDERTEQVCLPKGTRYSKTNSASFLDALPTLMWFSHNRTLEAFYSKFGIGNINDRARAPVALGGFGLTNTNVYSGCALAPKQQPKFSWKDNRTTLRDMSWLYEGVQTGVLAPGQALNFDQYMTATLAGGLGEYSSPITGKSVMVGPATRFADLISEEAGSLHAKQVEEFTMRAAVWSKGGSGGPSPSEQGFTVASKVMLPFYENGEIVYRYFTTGAFVYGLTRPKSCVNSSDAALLQDILADPAASSECKELIKQELKDFAAFTNEMMRVPIRMAWASWPTPTGPSAPAVVMPTPSQTPSPSAGTRDSSATD